MSNKFYSEGNIIMKKIISILMAILCLVSASICTTSCFAEEKEVKSTSSKSQYLQTRRYNVGSTVGSWLDEEGVTRLVFGSSSVVKSKKDKYGDIVYYAAKKGTCIAKAYRGEKYVGKVKIIVGDFKTVLKSNSKKLNLSYNKYVSFNNSEYYTKYQSYKKLSTMISFPKKGAMYSIKTTGKSILKMANNEIYTVGVGTSTYTLYQKVGNNKATKVGNFTATVKNVNIKTATAVKINNVTSGYDNFYVGDIEDLSVKEKYNFTNRVIKEKLTSKNCGVYVAPKHYKVTYTIKNTKVATVSKSGVVTGKKKGVTKLTFKITFADKSVYTNSVNVLVI